MARLHKVLLNHNPCAVVPDSLLVHTIAQQTQEKPPKEKVSTPSPSQNRLLFLVVLKTKGQHKGQRKRQKMQVQASSAVSAPCAAPQYRHTPKRYSRYTPRKQGLQKTMAETGTKLAQEALVRSS